MYYRPPTVREYYALKNSKDVNYVQAIIKDITLCDDISVPDFLYIYLFEIEAIRNGSDEYKIPHYNDGEQNETHYKCNSQEIKIVADYTHHSFYEILDMAVFDFWGYLHDAIVWDLSKSQSGRDYLEKCWTHSQTEPDRAALRERYGGARHGK